MRSLQLLSVCMAVLCVWGACPSSKRFRDVSDINPRTGRPFPNVLLYSHEGSGNTWVRLLLENTTGMDYLRGHVGIR